MEANFIALMRQVVLKGKARSVAKSSGFKRQDIVRFSYGLELPDKNDMCYIGKRAVDTLGLDGPEHFWIESRLIFIYPRKPLRGLKGDITFDDINDFRLESFSLIKEPIDIDFNKNCVLKAIERLE